MEIEELKRIFYECVEAQRRFNEAEKPYLAAKEQHDRARHNILLALKPRKRETEFRVAMTQERETHEKLTEASIALQHHQEELDRKKKMLLSSVEETAKS